MKIEEVEAGLSEIKSYLWLIIGVACSSSHIEILMGMVCTSYCKGFITKNYVILVLLTQVMLGIFFVSIYSRLQKYYSTFKSAD